MVPSSKHPVLVFAAVELYGGAGEAKPSGFFLPPLHCSRFPTLVPPFVFTDQFFVGLDDGGTAAFLLAECEKCSERIDRRGGL